MGPEHPLHEVDGFSIWYEARLLEEGIEDMENLTTANLVDVMPRNRVSINRLVDWLDQAFLYLHLPGSPSERRSRRDQLLHLGTRTASDLEAVWRRGANDAAVRQQFGHALDLDATFAAVTVQAVVATLDGEANYWYVQQHRSHEWLLRDERRVRAPVCEVPRTTGRTDPASDAATETGSAQRTDTVRQSNQGRDERA